MRPARAFGAGQAVLAGIEGSVSVAERPAGETCRQLCPYREQC